MPRVPITHRIVSLPNELDDKLAEHDTALDRLDGGSSTYYTTETSVAAPSGTLSVAVMTSYVELDGTDARALPAPTFAGQLKRVLVTAGVNTPVLVLTVTGMKVSTADVYTSGTWTGTNAPLGLEFFSADGVTWDPPVMIGTWVIS